MVFVAGARLTLGADTVEVMVLLAGLDALAAQERGIVSTFSADEVAFAIEWTS